MISSSNDHLTHVVGLYLYSLLFLCVFSFSLYFFFFSFFRLFLRRFFIYYVDILMSFSTHFDFHNLKKRSSSTSDIIYLNWEKIKSLSY